MIKRTVTLTALSVAVTMMLSACATVTVNTGAAADTTANTAAGPQENTTAASSEEAADTADTGDGGNVKEDQSAEGSTGKTPKSAVADFLEGLKYSADFKQAFYIEYGSKDKAKGHEGDLIYIKGEAGEYDKAKKTLKFSADDGEWVVIFDKDTTDDAAKTLGSLAGTKMRVFGTFTGISDEWDLPSMTITKDAVAHACRLEDLDGNIRIMYADTVWKDTKPDTDYFMGNLIWSGVEEWEGDNFMAKEDGIRYGTVTYYPVKDRSTNIYVYYEKLPKDKANWKDKDADKMLDKVSASYFDGEEVIEKEKTKVAGLNAYRALANITPDNSDISIECIQYVILDKDAFYGILFTETFYLGEKMAAYEKTFMDSFRYNESGKIPRKKDPAVVAKISIEDEDTLTDDGPKGEPAKMADITGKMFSQHMETIRIVDGEEILAGETDSEEFMLTPAELEAYDEKSGKLKYSNDGVNYDLDFYMGKDGAEYIGKVTVDGDKEGYLAASGHETEKKDKDQ
ncbi:MAG: hypothetical protein K6E49_05755 [Lachnospiraceae bacterium]|nr:hypothetical protein [Lachnospiraceae bacterium]